MSEQTFWFIVQQATVIAVIYVASYVGGTLVVKKGLKVNYSRKIIHFSGFLAPVLVTAIMPVQTMYSISKVLWGTAVSLLSMAVYTKPVRERSAIAMRMFHAMDRPEDRPHTLLWLYTQMVAGALVLIPVVIYFQNRGLMMLATIPILINGLGDGLAEPVGVRWGKHKYNVRALFTKQTYTRSIEGSACVFITSILALVLFRDSFTGTQLLILLLVVPLASTLAEAFSPHTWDTPFILLTGSIPLILVRAL